MKIAPVPLENGASVVYVVSDPNDAEDCLTRVHETLASMQNIGFPNFSAISQPDDLEAIAQGNAQPSDASGKPMHTNRMNDISREELDARLENQQLKVDARLKEFEGRVTDGLTQMNHSLQLLDKDLAGVRGLKGTIILNSIISVIAIVGIVIAVMSYGVANFDSGRDTSAAIQEMKQQSIETRQLLEQIKAQQASQK